MSTNKQKFEIFDAYGARIYVAYVDDPKQGLSGAVLEAFNAPYAKLPAMNFSGCTMYWALLEGADLSFSDFSGADLSGINLKGAVLRHANFRRTRFSPDAFGNSGSIAGADLTDAVLLEATLRGVEYDCRTVFPADFDPDAHGMVLVGAET